MSSHKTDHTMLRECGKQLESYAEENVFNIKRCSEYQWNISQPVGNMLLSVYPGSGLIYATRLHYTGTGIIDSTGKKYYFNDKVGMVDQLNKIFFAGDMV